MDRHIIVAVLFATLFVASCNGSPKQTNRVAGVPEEPAGQKAAQLADSLIADSYLTPDHFISRATADEKPEHVPMATRSLVNSGALEYG